MKKILPVLLLFFVLCLPSFSASVHVPDITIEQAKGIAINYLTGCGWSLKDETEHSINFYKTETAHDQQKYQYEQLIYEKYIKEGDSKIFIERPSYWNSTKTTYIQYCFFENNGVTIQTNSTAIEVEYMMKNVFAGHYSYEIEYKIPLIKKSYILISDTAKTFYEGQARLGNKRRISKINDKDISNYSKDELRHLLGNCPQEKIKLETDDKIGKQVFYINRVYTEPSYRHYL